MLKSLIIAISLLIPALAQAQANCGKHADVVATLKGKYGEKLVSRGVVAGNGSVIEIWASEDGSTWTLLLTGSDGMSCIGAAGHSLRGFKRMPGDDA